MTLFSDYEGNDSDDLHECAKCGEVMSDYISKYTDSVDDETGYWVCDVCAAKPDTFGYDDDECAVCAEAV